MKPMSFWSAGGVGQLVEWMGKERSTPCAQLTPRTDGYFLECRKDAQCSCRMCEASIHATLDLRPHKNLFHAITNTAGSPCRDLSDRSKGRGKENMWHDWETCEVGVETPPQIEQMRAMRGSKLLDDADQKLRECMKRNSVWKRRLWQILFLALLMELVVPLGVSLFYTPILTSLDVRRVVEDSMIRKRLVDRLDFVERKISKAASGETVSNCTGADSRWKLAEDEQLVHSSCDIFSTWMEKVSVWGYPAKTGGVLGREFVDRSFTVLSGRVMEWREGQIEFIIHPENSSWTFPKWAASAIILDENTWVIEYRRTLLSQGAGSFFGLLHLSKSCLRTILLNLLAAFDRVFLLPLQSTQWRDSRVPPT